MSMARRRAVVINHAPGLSGMPCSGHFSNAATRLSWTTSSARSKSPIARTSAAVSRPASSRKTATTAASVAVRVCSAVLGSVREPSGFRLFNFSRVVAHRPHFDSAGPPSLRDSKRLVEILDLHNREASDDRLRFDVRPVGNDGLAILDAHRCRAAWALELLTTDESACPGLLLEPLARALICGGKLVLRQLLKRILVLAATHEHKDVLHRESLPIRAVPVAASFIPRTGGAQNRHRQDPVKSGSCLARNDMMPIAASVLMAARAKLAASMSSPCSSGTS